MVKKVWLLTPAYDGGLHVNMADSLIKELFLLNSLGYKVTWEFYPGCCYLPIARNILVDRFMKNGGTDAIFIDADVQWETGSTLKLLKHDVDIVAGAYPYKTGTGKFPVVCEQHKDDGTPVISPVTGLIEAKGVPTGFLRIRRNVFEEMQQAYPDLWVKDYRDPEKPTKYFGYFDTHLDKVTKQWWGEDLHFCNQWRKIGGKIYIEPDINFYHHGLYGFGGNFHEYLRTLPGGDKCPNS